LRAACEQFERLQCREHSAASRNQIDATTNGDEHEWTLTTDDTDNSDEDEERKSVKSAQSVVEIIG
jgi:hypothetical protein